MLALSSTNYATDYVMSDMKIYGIDFTSSPKQGKGLWLAECNYNNQTLTLENIEQLEPSGNDAFLEFKNRLLENQSQSWVAGIDFPFGVPIEFLELFDNERLSSENWRDYVGSFSKGKENFEFIYSAYKAGHSVGDEHQYNTESYNKDSILYIIAEVYRAGVENGCCTSEVRKHNQKAKLEYKRLTDFYAGGASPLKIFNPPVGKMFAEGSRLIAGTQGLHVLPFDGIEGKIPHNVVIEAYPALVVHNLLHGNPEKQIQTKPEKMTKTPYKNDDEKKFSQDMTKNRVALFEKIFDKNKFIQMYDFKVKADPESIRSMKCDHTGDKLDSLLCAIQAAWAYVQKVDKKKDDYGIPNIKGVVDNKIRLEGWIVDPYTKARWDWDNKKVNS